MAGEHQGHGHGGGHHAPEGAHDFKVGEHVLADFGDNAAPAKGFVVAHILQDAHDVGGETKYGIQAPDGQVHQLGYRETQPGDVTGRTFKRIP